MAIASDFAERVERVVRAIPRGRAMTYGDVAAAAGSARAARAVGTLLRTRFASLDLPWHRVINAAGGISVRGDIERAEEQRRRLVQEGHTLDADLRLGLEAVRWRDLPKALLEAPPADRPDATGPAHRTWYIEEATPSSHANAKRSGDGAPDNAGTA